MARARDSQKGKPDQAVLATRGKSSLVFTNIGGGGGGGGSAPNSHGFRRL